MTALSYGHIKAAYASIRAAKLKSFWTMFGVIVGVAAVITVVAIGNGIKQQIAGQIHHLGKDIITVTPKEIGTGSKANSNGLGILSGLSTAQPLTLKDIKNIENVKGVGNSAPLTITNGEVKSETGKYTDGYVIGTSADLPSLINQSMTYGSFFNEDDYGTNVAVIGSRASEKMFNTDVPLGRSFSFHGQEFIVRGVFNPFGANALSQQADFNNAIFIPNNVSESLTNNTAPTYQMLVRAENPSQTNKLAADIQRTLDQAHGGQSNFTVRVGSQNVASSNNILTLLTRLIAGTAAISLFVGGIGIMNVMLVTVSERKHEIGIRKAVGATNRQILNQFLLESSVLTFVGGLIGVLLAYISYALIRAFTDLKPIISWQIIVIALGVSLIVGMVFGTVPALQAARKDPIEALRSE